MNRGLNLPQIQRIMNEFEKENSMMDMKEEMMSDAVDDVMDDEAEDEEEEGDKILKEVLDEIGVGLSQQVRQFTAISLCQRLMFRVHSAHRCPHWTCSFVSANKSTTRSSGRNIGSCSLTGWRKIRRQRWS